ncbi:MAG: MATE family efflux transporter [Clostridia bacterium]|nr:MATE family efflux transporter [Clostridia bacterium]
MASPRMSMCEGPFLKKILLYTLPIILTGLLQLTFNAADLIIVGQFCGSISVAAVGTTGALTNLIVNLFMGLSVGCGVTVAQALGAGQEKEVHRIVHTAIPTALISGIVLTVVGVCFSKTFLQWMGTPEDDVLPLASLYMKIFFGGILGPMVINFGAAILRASGDTKSPLIFLSLAGIINVGLNTVFVTLFHLDVAGVALATIISQFFAAAMILITLCRRTDACKLDFRKLKFYKGPLLKMIRIGVPSGIQGSMFSISNVILQSSINAFGAVFMSGSAAAANLEGFLYTSVNSFHQSALNFVGQNVGARRYDNVRKIVRICISCALILGTVLSLILFLNGERLLSIYISDSEEALHYGLIRMTYVMIPYFTIGLMDVMSGVLRGMGMSLTPMLISVLGVCGIRIGWVYTGYQYFSNAPTETRAMMLFLVYPVSWLVTAIAEIIAYRIVMKKSQRKLEQMTQNQS